VNEHPATAARDDDEWIEQLLVADAQVQRDAYLDDDGFTARVMTALPAPALRAPRWRKPAVTALWATAGIGLAFALPGAVQDVAREVFVLVSARPFSLSGIGGVLAALALATYGGAALALRRD
jgi:hypothetical protein